MNPRKPTQAEKNELVAYYISEGYGMGTVSEEEVKSGLSASVDLSAIAVFDNYHYDPDHQGYSGKVLVKLPTYYLHPGFVEIFVWHDGKVIGIKSGDEMERVVSKSLQSRGK